MTKKKTKKCCSCGEPLDHDSFMPYCTRTKNCVKKYIEDLEIKPIKC